MSAASLRAGAALLCAAALIAGCSRPAGGGAVAVTEGKAVPREMSAPADASDRRASLATTRRVELELDAERIVPVFHATLAACDAAVAERCVVLDSQLTTGQEQQHASVTVRAAPAAVQRILATLRSDDGFVSESASAEDLAAPIADSERQLAMQHEYRDSLLALRSRGSNDITALIKINEELAKVQSQLEASTGERAHLQQRIATETLVVSLDGLRGGGRAFWPPISGALHEFGAHLSEAVAAVITFIAFLIPWTVVLVPLGWLVRRLWGRWRRKA
jgi:hypothetical protein